MPNDLWCQSLSSLHLNCYNVFHLALSLIYSPLSLSSLRFVISSSPPLSPPSAALSPHPHLSISPLRFVISSSPHLSPLSAALSPHPHISLVYIYINCCIAMIYDLLTLLSVISPLSHISCASQLSLARHVSRFSPLQQIHSSSANVNL